MEEVIKLHLAIIPDGNRRWAKRAALRPWEGHEAGMTSFKEILLWAVKQPQLGVLTIWGFSTENWNRSEAEVSHLMKYYEQWLVEQRQVFHEHKTRLIHSGRRDRIPASLAKLLEDVVRETKHYTDFTLNFALDYGGKDEIVRAVNKLLGETTITEESLRAGFDHPDMPDIDIIVRTSGEQRISNFFMWQGAYAELFFINCFFPDLKVADLENVLAQYATRQRRFGK